MTTTNVFCKCFSRCSFRYGWETLQRWQCFFFFSRISLAAGRNYLNYGWNLYERLAGGKKWTTEGTRSADISWHPLWDQPRTESRKSESPRLVARINRPDRPDQMNCVRWIVESVTGLPRSAISFGVISSSWWKVSMEKSRKTEIRTHDLRGWFLRCWLSKFQSYLTLELSAIET